MITISANEITIKQVKRLKEKTKGDKSCQTQEFMEGDKPKNLE